MSIGGRWNAVLKSPMGPMEVLLDITEAEDGSLEGTASDKRQTMVMENGRIEGDAFSWVFKMKGLMTMTLEISGTVAGDKLDAMVKVGNRGSFPLLGERVAGTLRD